MQRTGCPQATPPGDGGTKMMRAYRFSPSLCLRLFFCTVLLSPPPPPPRERATARGNSLRSGRRFQTPRPVELRPCVKYCHHLCCTVLPTTEDDASMYLLYEEKKKTGKMLIVYSLRNTSPLLLQSSVAVLDRRP